MNKQGLISGELLNGKYRIDQLLGQGGMGAVYRAVHLGTKRTVAVKVIHPQFSINEEFVERFRREAEAAGRLRHPNIVDVTDFGFARINDKSIAYLVMEYLDGCTLAEVLEEERKLPPNWVVDILEQVCSAVDEAHRLGIIHRDLKPDNIWLEPNRLGGFTVKVLDLGLVKMDFSKSTELKISSNYSAAIKQTGDDTAINNSATLIKSDVNNEAATQIQQAAASVSKAISGENKLSKTNTSLAEELSGSELRIQPNDLKHITKSFETVELTRLGSVMGTPLYMSPEQCRGEQLGATSDIYSLGIIAYRMLTGEPPFKGTVAELLKSHQMSEPPPIREKNPKVPKKMANLVMSALSKQLEQRPQNAAGFASALRVSTEGSNYLLRRAVSLYSEHFPVFFKLSLIAYTPLILVIAVLFIMDSLELSTSISGAVLFTAMLIANLLAYFVVSAATVPVVVQLTLAPLRPAHLKNAFAALWKRWRIFVVSSIVVTTLILLGTTLFIIPGILAAVLYALYSPVVVMEDLDVRATLKRARELMKRNLQTGLIITILQFALPILVLYFSTETSFVFKLADDWGPKELGFTFAMSGTSSIYQLINIFITPLTAIMTALLYLKTRRAGGESLRETLKQVDMLGISGSRWQKSVRNTLS